ncbi:mitochondrial membrane protein [Desmophyllum pertusum]|uniref:Mitochondrial fission 1 protein n=1 Tax=Desmophyllum pertusum TaxID=174260 RepID=A0A9W9ZHF3_9CNID|nr:mitochondrial membrane protein [Desmophyllum pertusum]
MEETISKEDVKRFEEQYNAELEKGTVSSDTQFSYAWCLIRSDNKNDILKGVLLLQGLCHSGADQRDYLYFIAEGYYKLNEYKSALRYTNRLLQIEPQNQQGVELQEKITGQMKKDGLIGLGILGGTALLFGGAAALVGLAFAGRK